MLIMISLYILSRFSNSIMILYPIQVDPVVATDGHTYERSAIARWLKTSDKSPMTGSVLFYKELVPNYGLLSNVQDGADRKQKAASSPLTKRANCSVKKLP